MITVLFALGLLIVGFAIYPISRIGGDNYKEGLWTPIKLHYTEKWLKEHLIDSIN